MRRTGWTQAEGGGYGLNPVSGNAGPREEDTDGVAATRTCIVGRAGMSNAGAGMGAMQWAQRQSVHLLGRVIDPLCS